MGTVTGTKGLLAGGFFGEVAWRFFHRALVGGRSETLQAGKGGGGWWAWWGQLQWGSAGWKGGGWAGRTGAHGQGCKNACIHTRVCVWAE